MARSSFLVRSMIFFGAMLFVSAVNALDLNGFTRFQTVVDMSSAVAARVDAVKVRAGQHINSGDILVELDQSEYQALLQRAKATEKALLPAFQTTQLELERAQELYDRDSLSLVELSLREAAKNKAEGEYETARADVLLAEYRLQQTLIRAPVSGRVLSVSAGPGTYVDPSVMDKTLVSLVESRRMLAVAALNSEQWDSRLVNKPATVTFANQRYDGRVSALGLTRVAQSSGLPAYEVMISFETDELIPADMPVTITISD